MAIGLPFHENPNSRVFGIIGQLSESDNGKTYIKISDDTSNVGWQDIVPTTTTPSPTTTTTTTSSPTTTTTSGPTTTTTSGPTTTTVSPTTTTTISPTARAFNISPAVSGKSVWNLDVDGPLTVADPTGQTSWQISPYASYIFLNYELHGGLGGNGGSDDYAGGNGTVGAKTVGTFLLTETFVLYPGASGQNGADSVSGTGGGSGGAGYYVGGFGGDAGPEGVSGGGGGGGGASVIIRQSKISSPTINVDIFIAGGGAGGGGGGQFSAGDSATFGQIPPVLSNGTHGVSNSGDGGGGGGGGACGGGGGNVRPGDFGAEAGGNGGGNSGAGSPVAGTGYIYLY
jgi:hypothetical protein